ncbi:MAG TPA: transposase, partial [Balneolaceae bacterium]|nr:transposase [Balneolaceae bacterium]
AEFFVTFRLSGSLPKKVIEQLKKEQETVDRADIFNLTSLEKSRRRKTFKKYDDLLDGCRMGPTWLENSKVAQVVWDSMFFFDQVEYDLYAFTIMPNHVHSVFKLLPNLDKQKKYPVTSIIGRLKSYTANECNQILKKSGPFWQEESYDHVIRDDDELGETIKYVIYNPVKAGLVEGWKDWKYTYCRQPFLNII